MKKNALIKYKVLALLMTVLMLATAIVAAPAISFAASADATTDGVPLTNEAESLPPAAASVSEPLADLSTSAPPAEPTASSEYSALSSGLCGADLTYYLTGGVLEIIGTGPMYNTWDMVSDTPPWYGEIATITSIDISDGVTSIGHNAFRSCTNLKSIKLPDTLESIGDSAFYECDNLTDVLLAGTSITSIGDTAFYRCDNLSNVTFPNNLVSIGYSAFNGCVNLSSVTLLKHITSIGAYAFANCTNLKAATIPGTGQKRFAIPENITRIEEATFANCLNLTDVIIPDAVTFIGINAFGNTGLVRVDIPENVTKVETDAFKNCASLMEARFEGNGNTNLIGTDAFDPTVRLRYYEGSTGWALPINGHTLSVIPDSDDLTFTIENAQAMQAMQAMPGTNIDIKIKVKNNAEELTAITLDVDLGADIEWRDLGVYNPSVTATHPWAFDATAAIMPFLLNKAPGKINPGDRVRFNFADISGSVTSPDGTLITLKLYVKDNPTGDADVDLSFDIVDARGKLNKNQYVNNAGAVTVLPISRYGDADGNGNVEHLTDALYLARHLVKWPGNEAISPAADVDRNGIIDMRDVLYQVRCNNNWPGYIIPAPKK